MIEKNISELEMISQGDKKAITETYYVLNNLKEKRIIPEKIFKYLEDNKSDDLLEKMYFTKYSVDELSNITKDMISYIIINLTKNN